MEELEKDRANSLNNLTIRFVSFLIYKEKKIVHLQSSFSAILNFGNSDAERLFLRQLQTEEKDSNNECFLVISASS